MRQRRKRLVWADKFLPFEHHNWRWFHDQRWQEVERLPAARFRSLYRALTGEKLHLDGQEALSLFCYAYLDAWCQKNGDELKPLERQAFEPLKKKNRELAEVALGQREMALQWQ